MSLYHSNGAGAEGRLPVVLLVEDELMIRMADAESLRDAGFCVIEADCGAHALPVLESSIAIDLLITDITMPGEPDGLGLAAWCRDHRPHLPILLASARLPAPGDSRADGMLAKPYAVSQLLQIVNQLLGDKWQTTKGCKAC